MHEEGKPASGAFQGLGEKSAVAKGNSQDEDEVG
jgi:hypothetical protein